MTDGGRRALRGADRRRGAGGRRRRARARRGRCAAREPYTHAVPYSHRSGARIEPLISLQWFMRMDELARAGDRRRCATGACASTPTAGRASTSTGWRTSGRGASRASCGGGTGCRSTTATPARRPTSRARRRSAAAPATGRCARTRTCSTPGSRARCGRSRRSAGPSRRTRCAPSTRPTSLVTARDIIFLWVARMIMMGLEFTGEVPFADVYVHAVIQAPDGRRMSKSLGTGIDPLEEIDRSGADAVRFGHARDVLDPGRPLQRREDRAGRAARQQALQRGALRAARRSASTAAPPAPAPTAVEDRWILSRLARAERELARADRAPTTSRAPRTLLYDFVYGELCDWYIELVKARLDEPRAAARRCGYVLRRDADARASRSCRS